MQAVIRLILKKDRDKCFIKNWRPISLFNVDVKIAFKALANRVKKVIPKLIAVYQTAYVKGRFIGESIRVINDLIEHIERESDEGILFSTDIEKTFDSVDHTFLFSTLEKFGFGLDFINCIRTLLFNTQSCVMGTQQDILIWEEEQDEEIFFRPICLFLFLKFYSFKFIKITRS